jgi:hypothetical protein
VRLGPKADGPRVGLGIVDNSGASATECHGVDKTGRTADWGGRQQHPFARSARRWGGEAGDATHPPPRSMALCVGGGVGGGGGGGGDEGRRGRVAGAVEPRRSRTKRGLVRRLRETRARARVAAQVRLGRAPLRRPGQSSARREFSSGYVGVELVAVPRWAVDTGGGREEVRSPGHAAGLGGEAEAAGSAARRPRRVTVAVPNPDTPSRRTGCTR